MGKFTNVVGYDNLDHGYKIYEWTGCYLLKNNVWDVNGKKSVTWDKNVFMISAWKVKCFDMDE